MSASSEELLDVGDIGDIVARSIIEYFGNEEHKKLITS